MDLQIIKKDISWFMYDIIIIGAGPVGMFASYIGAKMGLKIAIIDKQHMLGGQCSAVYPDKMIDDIPGMNILGRDLIRNLENQMNLFSIDQFLGSDYLLDINNNEFMITINENILYAKYIVFATGFGVPMPNKPKLSNIEILEKKELIQYYMIDLNKFQDKVVVVGGGGDSAADWCIELGKYAKKIYLIHRKNRMHCMKSSYDLLENKKDLYTVLLERIIQKIDIIDDSIQLFTDHEVLSADYFVPCYGMQINNLSLSLLNLKITSKYKIIVDHVYQSSIENIYAVGDANYYDNKNYLITVGWAEAVNCVYDIYYKKYKIKYPSY